MLFGLTHSQATNKIRRCCDDKDELALLILRRPDKDADDTALTSREVQPLPQMRGVEYHADGQPIIAEMKATTKLDTLNNIETHVKNEQVSI